MILGLCERFGALPSQLLEEDASLLAMCQLEALGRPDPAPSESAR